MTRRGYTALMAMLGARWGRMFPARASAGIYRGRGEPGGGRLSASGLDPPRRSAWRRPSTRPRRPPELTGPQPVEVYIRRALAEDREVQAARFEAWAQLYPRHPAGHRARRPGCAEHPLALPEQRPPVFAHGLHALRPDDPVRSSPGWEFSGSGARWPSRRSGWPCGSSPRASSRRSPGSSGPTTSCRTTQRAGSIVPENRNLAAKVVEIARVRYQTGGSGQQDVLRAEVAVAEMDRELVDDPPGGRPGPCGIGQAAPRQPRGRLADSPRLSRPGRARPVRSALRVAAAARPELQGRLAASTRRPRGRAARKRYYPDVQLGVGYYS